MGNAGADNKGLTPNPAVIKKGSFHRLNIRNRTNLELEQTVNPKAAIFNTAIRRFASQGHEATTTPRIARDIGVTEFFVFYPSKTEIL